MHKHQPRLHGPAPTISSAAWVHARPVGSGLALSFVAAGLLLSAAMAIGSTGVHHEDDLTHLQIARWVWQYPAYLLDDWGRPGFTVLYAIPAGLGWLPARLFSGILTAVTAWFAYLTAVQLRIRLAPFVPLFVWLQPLVFTLSYTTLTETALAFYLTLAVWLYIRGCFGLSAAAISLCAVTRHEAGLFLVLWSLALLYRRRPAREWMWIFWAPALHNVLAFAFLHEWPLHLLLQPQPTREYGHGTPLTMLALWPLAAGFGLLLLACIGVPAIIRRRGGLLWVASAAVYFAAHSVLYAFGLFASGGYARFLVPLGPVVAVCAAQALSQYWRVWRQKRRHAMVPRGSVLMKMSATALAVVLVLWLAAGLELERLRPDLITNKLLWSIPTLHAGALLLALLYLAALACSLQPRTARATLALTVVPTTALAAALAQPIIVSSIPRPFRQCAPLRLSGRERAYRAAVDVALPLAAGGAQVFSASPWVDEFLHRVRPPVAPRLKLRWKASRPGDVLIWDAREAASPRHHLPLAQLTSDPGLVELWRSTGDAYDPVYCAVFEKKPQREPPR